MRITLKTDFADYYDPWFDREGDVVFERISTGGMSRIQMFRYFSDLGLVTPVNGEVTKVCNLLAAKYKEVVGLIKRFYEEMG